MKIYKLFFSLALSFLLFYIIFVAFYFDLGFEDNSLWHYIGWSWSEFNDPLLKKFADNKPFGIYFLYYFSSLIFGINFYPIILLCLLIKLISGYIIYVILTKLIRDKYYSLSGLMFFYSLSSWTILDAGADPFTEVFVNFFLILSIYLILNFKNKFLFVYLTLLLLFFAFIFKQTIIFAAPAFIFLIFIRYKENFYEKMLKIIFFCLFISFIYFLALNEFGISYEKIFKQTFFPLNYTSDTVMSLTARINNFIYQWSDKYKLIGIIVGIFIMYSVYFKKTNEEVFLFMIFFLILIGVHFTGITNGHQMTQIIPLLCILLPIIIFNLSKNFELDYKQSLLGLLFFLFVLFPDINFSKIKKSIKEFKTDKSIFAIKEIKTFLDDNYKNEVPIHQHFRNSEVMLNLERQAASRFINTSFLYGGYGHGEEIEKNISILNNDLNTKKKHLIIALENYDQEPPYRYPNFLKDRLDNYTFIKKFNKYLLYESN